jgi:hypothetical protein
MVNAENGFFRSMRPLLASLAAFAHAGLRPKTLLAGAIVTVLVIKLVAVAAMMFYQHYEDRSAVADSAGVAYRLGPSSTP